MDNAYKGNMTNARNVFFVNTPEASYQEIKKSPSDLHQYVAIRNELEL